MQTQLEGPFQRWSGQGKRRQPGQAGTNGEQVSTIHLLRFIQSFAQAKGDSGHGGRQKQGHLLEQPLVVGYQQLPRLQRPSVITGSVATSQQRGSQQDSAAHLRPKTCRTILRNPLLKALIPGFGALPVTHSIIAGQVGRGLCRGQKLIGAQGQRAVGSFQFHQLPTGGGKAF